MVLLTQGTQLEPSKKNKPLTKYFLFSLGLLFFICALIFLIIGTWKSAENYKKIKNKKKLGSGWAIAGQIYISLATLRGVVEIIKTFS